MMSVTESMKEGLFTYIGRFEEREIYNSRDPYISSSMLKQFCEVILFDRVYSRGNYEDYC